ncbi:Protein of unknown function [Thermanaeromonas toyohensis ToBE]|uniref:Uncharacterized protein n=1 Tax=Thermanaeromonas toyohensis ToBE TaxID=698762 RepID=A0A1W1VXQ3_9FIRM|nr:DUF1515 domain-containing protein [Thermanaeromonas toyohensis]SMB98030.1 Protein of unknown function [Thermanaeromonas toyohensis ToBE]
MAVLENNIAPQFARKTPPSLSQASGFASKGMASLNKIRRGRANVSRDWWEGFGPTSAVPTVVHSALPILEEEKPIDYNKGMKAQSSPAKVFGGIVRAREMIDMDWQEKYLDKLNQDIGDIKASLKSTEDRIAHMINQTLSEMRDRDNQRHAEILALRSDIQAIRTDNAETRRWIIAMVISAIGVALAAIIGIASIVYQALIK